VGKTFGKFPPRLKLRFTRTSLEFIPVCVTALEGKYLITNFKLFIPCILSTYEMKNQQMSLFQFYSYIDRSLRVSDLEAHPQENLHSCSHNHCFSGCTVRVACSVQSTRPERYSHWTNGCVNSCVNSPEDGPVSPKHVEIRQYMNKIEIVTSVGFSFHIFNHSYTKYSSGELKEFLWDSFILQVKQDAAVQISEKLLQSI
jgi:hypothetical protein